MASSALELLGFFLGLVGLLGTLTATVLPYWRSSAHIGSNIVTAVATMKGLWMECVFQSTGAFQCDTYNSMLSLAPDLQASRALMVMSVVLSILGLALATLGMQCTVCLDGSAGKSRVAGTGGGLLVAAGFLALIPVSWVTHEVVQTFYQPGIPSSMKFELGECLYVGLASALVSMLAGAFLCVSCCEGRDGGGRGGGGRRLGGGYPYSAATMAGVGVGARNGSQNYRGGSANNPPATVLQMAPPPAAGKGPVTLVRSHTSESSHSGNPLAAAQEGKNFPRHNPAPGYDVTGYV